jgi:hypothetical protein
MAFWNLVEAKQYVNWKSVTAIGETQTRFIDIDS